MTKGGATDGIRVEEALSATPEIVDALRTLLPQLSSSAPTLTTREVERITASPDTILLIARASSGAIIGSLTVVVFRLPTGARAWIEDVVVDEGARGGGVGSALVTEALARAEAEGSRTVDLTSRPSRVEANRLYLRLGFVQRDTNVYRRQLET